ncbi:putative cation transport regulator ChaB [Klebsiella pneumoniae subsp. pneumoniae]|uniref:Putative cation transport regulator ChaB n=1 Tax=Klebsiella pneumoniae subsp. pneumoniae TaxID=72407 RepID=A0A7S9HER2_KLEPN|nr:putative cation transport regulator ChaB [Klebsiella pneumoniae subsp. pneumoniae]RRE15981.1 putative cation transport regulator ChaB [Klebsiella pneumoniae]
MPYRSKQELPDSVQHVLPAHAQEIYKEAFNSARDQYKDKDERRDDASREETAHKVARAAVKNSYEKGDDDKWHKKNNR